MTGLKARLTDDESGVSSTLEYMLTFVIASIIFSIFVMSFAPLFLTTPQNVVSTNQYLDIGNDVTTKIIDTYMVAPEDGVLETYFDLPNLVGDKGYQVVIRPVGADSTDEVVSIIVDDRNIVNMTLNSASTTMRVNGSMNSMNVTHKISYDSSLK